MLSVDPHYPAGTLERGSLAAVQVEEEAEVATTSSRLSLLALPHHS